jgi:hypothetical protein
MRITTTALALTSSITGAACLGTGIDDRGEDTAALECSIPTAAIFSGGPSRDQIPALSSPEALSPSQSGIADFERVLGVVVNGEARAYPLFILWLHEVVNDRLGGEDVLVSYCPLTGSGIAFDPVIDGERRSFGVSGLLFENNLIMFDRQTESLWNQLLLGSQCGPDRGKDLQLMSIIETTLGHWRQLHPQTTVVTENTGSGFTYGFYPYGSYRRETNTETLFPTSPYSSERPPKELVLGVSLGGEDAAYPFGVLEQLGTLAAINEDLGGHPILVAWEGNSETARAFDRTAGGQTLTFSVDQSATFTFVDTETGSQWNLLGEAIAGPLQGSQLEPIANSYTIYWFAWAVYHSSTRVYR